MHLKSIDLFLENRPADRYGFFVLGSLNARPAETAACYRGWSVWVAQKTSQAVRQTTRIGLAKHQPHVTRVHCVRTVTVHFTALTSSDSLFFITFPYSCSTSWGQEGPHVWWVRPTAFQA